MRSRFCTEDFAPKVRTCLLGPADPRIKPFLFVSLIRALDQIAFGAWLFVVQMAKFAGKSPSADKAFAFGQRVRVDAGDVFPDETTVGVAPFRDLEGRPLYVGTMILDDSAIPCQVCLRAG